MDWSAAVRSFIVLICVFNPLSVLAILPEVSAEKIAPSRIHIFSLALCTALLLTFILFGVSLVYDLLGFEGRPIEITGGAILLVTALLEFQRKSFLFGWKAENPEGHSEKAAWLSLATVPSIAAVSFLIPDTNGSPTRGTYFLLAAVAATYYTLLGSTFKRHNSTARPHFRWLSKIPSGIVLIVAIDIILMSIWPGM